MNSSRRAPLRGNNQPFIMHLERVCRLIEMGARFSAIEFNPASDVGKVRNTLIKEVGLQISDGGGVTMILLDGTGVSAFGLTLANYKKVWRVWQNGVPTNEQRQAVRWG